MSTLHGEYRRHERTNIKTSVSVSLDENGLATQTMDVSESGISLSKPSELILQAGQTVNVSFNRLNNFSVPAKIVRVSDTQIGLELDHTRFSEGDITGIIKTSPWHQRLRVAVKRSFWKASRRLGVLIFNTILRKPMLALIKPTFIFAVYGNEKDAATYYTPLMSKFMPPLMIGSIIRNQNRRGIMVASKFFERELAEDSVKVRTYLDQLQSEFPHINTIALVGRLPNFAMKAGLDITPPYVDGSMGTRYMIWDIGRQMLQIPEYKHETVVTVLGGAGRIGNKVCEDLTREFRTVIAFDPRYENSEEIYTPIGKITRTNNPDLLKECKLFVGLTHHGDVIKELKQHLPAGSLVADDTHPCISYEAREELKAEDISVLKIVLTHNAFSMWPRMPGWNNRAIPGCLVEALVLLEQEDADVSDFDTFSQIAERIGFQGQLIQPLDE
jgi:hypothetical protein